MIVITISSVMISIFSSRVMGMISIVWVIHILVPTLWLEPETWVSRSSNLSSKQNLNTLSDAYLSIDPWVAGVKEAQADKHSIQQSIHPQQHYHSQTASGWRRGWSSSSQVWQNKWGVKQEKRDGKRRRRRQSIRWPDIIIQQWSLEITKTGCMMQIQQN